MRRRPKTGLFIKYKVMIIQLSQLFYQVMLYHLIQTSTTKAESTTVLSEYINILDDKYSIHYINANQ